MNHSRRWKVLSRLLSWFSFLPTGSCQASARFLLPVCLPRGPQSTCGWRYSMARIPCFHQPRAGLGSFRSDVPRGPDAAPGCLAHMAAGRPARQTVGFPLPTGLPALSAAWASYLFTKASALALSSARAPGSLQSPTGFSAFRLAPLPPSLPLSQVGLCEKQISSLKFFMMSFRGSL